MISRFFKKKPKPAAAPVKPKAAAPKEVAVPKEKPSTSKKLLTAEGWKRIMMRKMAAKGKK